MAKGDRNLQELYLHLEHSRNGDKYMSYYGQLRAAEYGHKESLRLAIKHFDLESQPWYIARNLPSLGD